MGLFGITGRREKRSETDESKPESFNEQLINNLEMHLINAMRNDAAITKTEALNIPTVQGCVNFISGIVSMLPVKLYRDCKSENKTGNADEVKDDPRVALLNDDTGDTLDASQFWRAMAADYLLGKGGYAYIKKRRNAVESIHYVDETAISINHNCEPIHKKYEIYVNGEKYRPFDFIKLLRNTKDGAQGIGIVKENQMVLSVAYNLIKFENNFVDSGGAVNGIIYPEERLAAGEFDIFKQSSRNINKKGIMAFNKGIKFQETSRSAVEMQFEEIKRINADEVCKLFNLSLAAVKGEADGQGLINALRAGVMPVLRAIECALNRDLLLECEKSILYFAFDTKEMLKGDIQSRYAAYKTALDSSFLQPDEVRYMEDLPPLGLNVIKLGLNTVLFDPATRTVYTPNTNQTATIGEAAINISNASKN